jgi:hypothetical protein
MPRRPILPGHHGFPEPNDPSYPPNAVHHNVVFPGFGPSQDLARRPSLENDLLATNVRLDYVLQEKRNLERKKQELQELSEKQLEFRKRRDQVVDEILRTLDELQESGHFEILRADAYERSGARSRHIRLNLETLQRLELKNPADYPKLAEGIARLRDAELALEAEVNQLEEFEAKTPVTHLFGTINPERRSLIEWFRLGLTFFLPVIVIGLGAVIVVIAFVGK